MFANNAIINFVEIKVNFLCFYLYLGRYSGRTILYQIGLLKFMIILKRIFGGVVVEDKRELYFNT